MKSIVIAWLLLLLPVRAATYLASISPTNPAWPGGVIPYRFETNITPAQQAVYLDGLREWELAGDIQFVPQTTETNYLLLRFDYLDGNNSLTYTAAYSQVMHVDRLSRAQVCHETGHALGLQHEQVRADRDAYITVIFSNIVPFAWPLYELNTNEASFGAYDFESIMHYGRDIFSVNYGVAKTYTVDAPYASYEPKMGYYFALSPGDRAAIANIYGPGPALSAVVTNTMDVGVGSLRAAMYYAHDHPGTTITFNISTNDPGYSNGVWTIHLSGHLPVLTGTDIVIDGSTQPGFSNHPVIAVNGSRIIEEAGPTFGFLFYGSRCEVRNLCIQGFSDRGVYLRYPEAASNVVAGCFIGTDARGLVSVSNAYEGVAILDGARHNTIGGTNALDRNVISGNGGYGLVILHANTYGNVVLGNYVGTTATGSNALPNAYSGIGIWTQAHDNVIGGDSASARNVISGNTYDGVLIADLMTTGNVVKGNFIGLAADGQAAIPNQSGVSMFAGASGNTVGPGNVLSGNSYYGALVSGSGSVGNVVLGNLIGLSASGSAAVSNATGVFVGGGATATRVVGGNLVAGNRDYGVLVVDPTTTGTRLEQNVVATNGTGIGIFAGVYGSVISGNVVAANSYSGLLLADSGTRSNDVRHNEIVLNGSEGIAIYGGASRNVIGPANRIASNTYNGVYVGDAATSGNTIRANAMVGNGYNGIELAGVFGPEANDAGDADAGPNGLQNHPVVTNASVWGGVTRITGVLAGAPSRAYAIDVYRVVAPDWTGHGEGAELVGSVTNTTSPGGILDVVFGVPGSSTTVQYTATATDLVTGDTSEFGTNRVSITSTNGPARPTIRQLAAAGGALFQAGVTNDVGWGYRLQRSTNLVVWVDATNYISQASVSLVIAVADTNAAQNFLRVVSP